MRENDHLHMLKTENEATCEGKDDLTATLCKNELEDIDPSMHSFMDNEASTNRNGFDSEGTDTLLHNPPDNTGLVEEETELFSDKSVTQIEATHIIDFAKDEEASSIVKDICLEEVEKVLLENNEVIGNTSVSATNRKNDLNGQMMDGAPPVRQDLKFISAVDEVIEDQNSSWSLFEVGEKPNTADKVTSHSSVQEINVEVLLTPGESNRDHCHADDHRQCIDEAKTEQTKVEDTCSTIAALLSGATESDKSSGVYENPTSDASKVLGEGCSTTSDMTSDSTISNHSGTEGNPANVKVENGLNNPRDSQEFLQVQNHSVSEVTTVPDSTTPPACSLFCHSNHGDNFSGPKVSSGHIAYSGNISMRSDSSTTSTRSFAFPILQTEWNTSPVKMAKARKKHRSWMGLVCCKF